MLLIKNGTLITPTGKREADIRIDGLKIAEIRENIEAADADEIVDAKECFVFPVFLVLNENDCESLEQIVKVRDLFDEQKKTGLLYELITGQKQYLAANGASEEEMKYAVPLFMHRMGEGMDMFGYMKLLCENPAKRAGSYPKRGAIAVGADANLVIWDPNTKYNIPASPKAQWYENLTALGKIRYEIQNGKLVTKDGLS